ncbi:uncharacterized protein LOC34618416 [Cyclospora cayetanensis]|uniref:Uncharacterized protein LOC34618416 n=1 Tax=Cyclospora cayetanensis TaxID=88456 RepID=A0A6P6RVP3_9EIME|nr:uncharacterized protein LOC34618416 [Cyclospora cayetanensis]
MPESLLAERSRSLRLMAPGCDYGMQFLYSAVLVAGKHSGSRSSLIDTSVEDILIAFFRLANLETTRFPLQWYAIENALKRSHSRAIQVALRRQQAEQQDYDSDPNREKPLEITVPEFTWLLGQQVRESEWFFDGNTFHKRGDCSIPEKLNDHHLGFMKSLPFNVLRVARGIEREEPSKTVAHLLDELAQRGIKTASAFLLKTNFLDILVSTSVIDETFLQLDILSEYISNWEAFKSKKVVPPSIPFGASTDILKTLMNKKSPKEKYPKCPTMRCYVESVWTQRAEHPLDKDARQKQEEEKKPKEQSSESFAELTIRKKTANSLKVVAIGNTGHETFHKRSRKVWDRVKSLLRADEFMATVEAMKQWHQREGTDIALGIGDFLSEPGMLSVREPAFREKWHDVFVKEAGLNIPWYMVNGEAESILTPSASYRYHYTRQDVNSHKPDWLHKAVITMVANLTKADGGAEDQEFTVHLISIDTWALFGGTPFYDNLGHYQDNMIALSNALFHSAKSKADWIIVQGHYPLTSTAPEAEEARFSYIDDMVKNGRPRGPEHRLVELLTAYQVDAYVSAHDHALEYLTMSDLDKNSTLAFITSGGGTRIMSGILGRGWMGVIRGKLFPVLCWSGKRIFYKLDPGGCKPSEKDQALAYKFYAPQGPNWKISVKERILNTVGFASMKITKDFLIVDFIDSRTGKRTGRKLHKQTNRDARAIKFIDFWEDADLKYKELEIDHAAFEEENRERVASEIAFQTRTPILSERVRLYEKELVNMYNEYQQLKTKKAMYETLTAQKAAALEAQGENLRESALSEGMYEQTERIMELMYVIAADHTYLWSRYEALKAQRKLLPAHDNQQAEAVLKLEKRLAEVKKERRDIHKKCIEQGYSPNATDAEQIRELAMKARILKNDIQELESQMDKQAQEGAPAQKPADEETVDEVEIKPVNMTLEARIERRKKQLADHKSIMEEVEKLPAGEKEKLRSHLDMMQNQKNKLMVEIEKLESILSRKGWAADRRPSELWEQRLKQFDLEQTLKQLRAYKASIIGLPKSQTRAKDLSGGVINIDLQILELEEQLSDLSDELLGTEETPLQARFKQEITKLRELNVLAESRATLPPEMLEDPVVRKTLEDVEQKLVVIQQNVEVIDEEMRRELSAQDEAWIKRMIVRGADMKELAEEFSIDIQAVVEEDEKARREDPQRQLTWLAEQEWIVRQRLARYAKLPPNQAERYVEERTRLQARLTELLRLKDEAEGALAAKQAADTQEDTAAHAEQKEQKEDTDDEASEKIQGQNESSEEEVSEEAVDGLEEELLFSDAQEVEEDGDVSPDGVSENARISPDTSETTLHEADDSLLDSRGFADSPGGKESSKEGGNEVNGAEEEGLQQRRLAELLEWFQPKKEETPVKELQKIDLGPKDPCEGDPMLYVVVKKAINAEYGAQFAERCKKVFASRAHRAQRRFLGLVDDSGNPGFYNWPHIHIVRGFKSLFGTTRLGAFAALMKSMRERMEDINSKIGVATFEDILESEETLEQTDLEEFVVVDEDAD